ncbi:MAG TPA: hypothetical protein VIN40_08080 [Candidatus Tyrphobacter sp.]
MNPRATVGGVVLIATILFALAPLYRGGPEPSTPVHHLLHALMIAGAAFSGILFAGSHPYGRPGVLWLLLAIVAPLLAMLLMWPSEYVYFETHRYGHLAEHAGLMLCGFATGYAGQRYANGIGWAAGISVVAMAILAIWGYGVAPATLR